jgi:hypothetical protein
LSLCWYLEKISGSGSSITSSWLKLKLQK